MYKNILIPIDPAHIESVEKSLQIAQPLLDPNGVITILSVLEELPAYVTSQVPDNLQHQVRLDIQKLLETVLSTHKLDAKIIIKDGHASGTIIDTQKVGKNDLIIIASHKPHNMDYLLGSTATRVVRKAQCPVFVIR